MREALAKKIFVLGVDGMDPRLTRKYVDMGVMPNTKKLIERGSCREDLKLLGGQPTVTPPMWTTLATGAYPCTHGITCFNGKGSDIDYTQYNLDSRRCKAEQLWNVFVEAGKKTLVFHWPGSSWPPTSDSPLLHVVDGTQPAAVNMGTALIDSEFVLNASVNADATTFRAKAATDEHVPCVVTDLEERLDYVRHCDANGEEGADRYAAEGHNLILTDADGESGISDAPFDVVLSQIKEPVNWAINVPEGAKEFAVLYSKGMINRPALILKNEEGKYDRVAIYKNKKATEPIVVVPEDVMVTDILDEAIRGDNRFPVVRSMRIIGIAEDGSAMRMWVSGANKIDSDMVWHPTYLYKEVVENCGYPKPVPMVGAGNKNLIGKVMIEAWYEQAKWYSAAIQYLIKKEEYEVVFSHFHNIDLENHMITKYMKANENSKLTEAEYQEFLKEVYIQTDFYIGQYMHMLDEDWTIVLVSDHAAVCPEHGHRLSGDPSGVSIRLLDQFGYTVLKRDENGNELKEVDYEKTTAVAQRANHIYINLKGRDPHGIVDPEDKYELEERIMTDLYSLKDEVTGHRRIALALRNKDAILLGLGGPESGDICYWNAEGYNHDHADSLSTTEGYADTSVGPIFIAAGPGIKENYKTDRWIRQVDVTPTLAVLGGVRMPKQCEGAVMYQILTEEY